MITATIEQLQLYVATANAFQSRIPTFQKHIEYAEREVLRKWFSMPVAQYLFDLNGIATEMIKNCIYNYAFYTYLPYTRLRVSNTGTTQPNTANEVQARPEDVEELRKVCYTTAMSEVEAIFEFLEEEKPGIWIQSDHYSVFNQSLIPTATQFQKYCNIRSSRRVFLSLKNSIFYVTDLYIKPALSKTLFDALNLNVLAPEKKVLVEDFIKPALAHLAFAEGLPELSVVLGKYDTILQFDNTGANAQKGYKQADANAVDRLITSEKRKGEEYLGKALDYILENIQSFPEYPSGATNSNKLDTVSSRTAVWF